LDKPCRILVVDDNPTNVAILVKSLQKAGHEVLAAEDGFAAVDLATSQQPDLILLDMMLPKRDGLAVCRILKSQEVTASIPVIFVTAVSEPDRMLKAFEVGGSDYVTKPFKTAEVLARVSVHAQLHQAEATLVQKNQQTEKLANDLAQANVQLARLSRTDPLTELLNRRAWEEAARREHDRFHRHGNPYSVLMIDVDHFKCFNDSQGHQAGDDCLRSVAASIASACRRLDVVGRYGGEEFVVLAPETVAEAALKLAERIRKVIWGLGIPHPASAVGERVTVSIGVATTASGSWENVLNRADDALYVAKRAGRNMVYADHRLGPTTSMPIGARPTTKLTGESSLVPEEDAIVLVADDDATSRTLFRTALKRKGYRVCEASNGRETLTEVAEQRPDVIIMDVMMPEIDGLECTRRIRANPETQDIPIIMISAGSSGCDVLAGLEAGADEYLTKPLQISELTLRVRSMVCLRRERKDLLHSYELRGEQTRILQCLLDFSQSVSTALELDEILDHALAATAEVTSSRRISVMLPDPDYRFLTIAKCVGMDEDLASTVRVPIGEMIAGHVFASRRAIVINNEQEAAFQHGAFDSHFFAATPLVSAPLRRGRAIIGVLNVTERFGQRPFEPRDLEYIDLIANITGSAVHGMLSRKARDQARDGIMLALVRLAEHRGDQTGRHVDRMTRCCLILAEELRNKPALRDQIDDIFLHNLECAVPLHDIGKVAIPDQILLKPGRLTPEETQIMRSHADIGADTIQSVAQRTPGAGFLTMAAEIARAHHEWYDSSGYPKGLGGDAIPLPARIVALADVYDALTTNRVYKEAIPHDKAVTIIADLSGTQFDPAVVEAFLARQSDFARLDAELTSEPDQPADQQDQQQPNDHTLVTATDRQR